MMACWVEKEEPKKKKWWQYFSIKSLKNKKTKEKGFFITWKRRW